MHQPAAVGPDVVAGAPVVEAPAAGEGSSPFVLLCELTTQLSAGSADCRTLTTQRSAGESESRPSEGPKAKGEKLFTLKEKDAAVTLAVAAALKVYKDQKSEQRSAAMREAKCHICGKTGHLVATCPHNNLSNQACEKTNMIARGTFGEDSDFEEEEDQLYSRAFSSRR
jgi:hypothetical protein